LPLLILYVDEKESIRIGRNIDLLSLERNIERYYNMIYEK
ncbi:Thioredoxin, partial [human gut metagenome]